MAATGSTSSSMTSTSHTLTAFPPPRKTLYQPLSRNTKKASPMVDLTSLLAPANRHAFIAPPPSLPEVGLQLVKSTLDRFAGTLGDEQAERLKEQRKKRKRQESGKGDGEVLKIRKVHVEGFEVEQVWEQARRVIDALRLDAERGLEAVEHLQEESSDDGENGEGGVELMKFDEDGFEIGSDDESIEEDEGLDPDSANEEQEDEEQDEEAEEGGFDEDEEGMFDAIDGDDGFSEEEEDVLDQEAAGEYLEDPHGLNDGFFSIDNFNKQTEFLEKQDAAADPYTGEASDEEDIDWDVDPMLMAAANPASSSRRAAAMDVEEEEEEVEADEDDEDDEDGPTFGNMDLDAPEGESGDENDEGMDEEDAPGDNTNDILYKDFFEPPPRKVGKGERQADYLSRQSRKPKAVEPEQERADMERAIADVRRDLFDESGHDDSEDALSEVDPSDPKSRRSAHERRQAKLSEEIRRLEAASVAKREWTLSGEARAVDRPKDSLLDEELEFERTGKPVPVITAEISESIEELIKRRILAQEFDEVIRRRPDSLNNASDARRGRFELDDTKAQQSLAEMYEEEHVRNTNPDTYVSKSDEKVRKEEREIEALWKTTSASLDALCSWHFKPKPAAPSLTVVSDVATIAMEDAQPTTASGMNGGESMLAPQEIYKAGQDKNGGAEKGEVVPKSGAPIARQEMTREEKLRRRRREKERIRKRGGEEIGQRAESKKTKQKREVVGDLKKAGVKVIGRKGEIRDVEGNKVKNVVALNGAGRFKL